MINKTNPPDIVIFSAAAHYKDPDLFRSSMKKVFVSITEFKAELLQSNSKVIPAFIWQQATPGHIGCKDNYSPLSSLSEFNKNGTDIYRWRLFEQLDKIAVDLCLEHNISYLDLSPLKYRADAHVGSRGNTLSVDCLHFCLPGPMSLFSRILLHKLEAADYDYERDASKSKRVVDHIVSYPIGTNISSLISPRFSLAREGSAVTSIIRSRGILLVENGTLRQIPNMDTFYALGLKLENVYIFPDNFIHEAPKGASIPPCSNCR